MGGVLEDKSSKKYEKRAKILAEEEKNKSYERLQRGLEGNIRTSHSGVLTSNNSLQRKKLLGE